MTKVKTKEPSLALPKFIVDAEDVGQIQRFLNVSNAAIEAGLIDYKAAFLILSGTIAKVIKREDG